MVKIRFEKGDLVEVLALEQQLLEAFEKLGAYEIETGEVVCGSEGRPSDYRITKDIEIEFKVKRDKKAKWNTPNPKSKAYKRSGRMMLQHSVLNERRREYMK